MIKATSTASINQARPKTSYGERMRRQLKLNIKIRLEVELTLRCAKPLQPPFPALQSFNASALILSYIDYQENVEPLLNSLSHNPRAYYVKHKDILDAILESVPANNHQISNDNENTQSTDCCGFT